jgi:hypothetical protein
MDARLGRGVHEIKGEIILTRPEALRERARRCRELRKITVVPAIAEQLKVWACDFEDEANETDERLAAARRALHQW